MIHKSTILYIHVCPYRRKIAKARKREREYQLEGEQRYRNTILLLISLSLSSLFRGAYIDLPGGTFSQKKWQEAHHRLVHVAHRHQHHDRSLSSTLPLPPPFPTHHGPLIGYSAAPPHTKRTYSDGMYKRSSSSASRHRKEKLSCTRSKTENHQENKGSCRGMTPAKDDGSGRGQANPHHTICHE